MEIIDTNYLSLLYQPYSWHNKNYICISMFALVDLKDIKQPKLKPAEEIYQQILPELDCDGMIDVVLPKIVPEFLVAANAYTAHQLDKSQVMLRAQVGELTKDLIVSGERYWLNNKITAAQEFTVMPVTRAKSFGGKDFVENPLGKGLDSINVNGINVVPLPNVEGLTNRIHKKNQVSKTTSFSPIPYLAPSRFKLQGNYTADWLKYEFGGFFPDMNPLLFNSAETDQRWHKYDEIPFNAEFKFWNMHPAYQCWQGTIPEWRARCFIQLKSQQQEIFQEIKMRATTVWFIPHQEKLILIYHGNTEIETDDATDVIALMPALETVKTNKPTEYYQKIYNKSLDFEVDIQDKDLVPADILFVTDTTVQSPAWQEKAMYRSYKFHQEIKEMLAEQGFDREQISDLIYEFCGPPSPFPPKFKDEDPEYKEQQELEEQENLAEAQAELDKMHENNLKQGVVLPKIDLKKEIAEILDPNQPMGISGPPEDISETLDIIDQYSNKMLSQGIIDNSILAPLTGETASNETPQALELPTEFQEKLRAQVNLQKDKEFKQEMLQLNPLIREGYLNSAQDQDDVTRLTLTESLRLREQLINEYQQNKKLIALDLTGADLSNMQFKDAIFHDMFMEGVNLTNSKFINCIFSKTVLTRANLNNTDFSGSSFNEVNLCLAETHQTNFSQTKFIKIILETGKFEECNFTGAEFADMSLENITIENTNFEQVTFKHCDWSNFQFKQVNFTSAEFVGTSFESCVLDQVNFQHAKISDSDFYASKLMRCDFSNCSMQESAIIQSELVECSFSQARFKDNNFSTLNLAGINFYQAQLEKCNFSFTNMQRVNLANSNCRGANFNKANLYAANLQQANLIEANFKSANLQATNFKQANLFRANLGKAQMDYTTKLAGMYDKQVNLYPLPRKN